MRLVPTLAFAYDRVLVASYDEGTHRHAGAICEVALELHFTRAKLLHCMPDNNSNNYNKEKRMTLDISAPLVCRVEVKVKIPM